MKNEKAKKPALAELIDMQKDIKKALQLQDRFIQCFQLLVRGGEELSNIINSLSSPAAVFERGGLLRMVNPAFVKKTDLLSGDLTRRKINFLDRVTNENFSLVEASESVFLGKTILLKDLSYPLSLFCSKADYTVSAAYGNALLFPLPDSEKKIRFGVVMLLK